MDKRVVLGFISVFACALFVGVLFIGGRADAETLGAKTLGVERIGARLQNPWGMDFITDTSMLVTERRGRLWRYDLDSGSRVEIGNTPDVVAQGQGGLLDVLVHEQDGQDVVYLCYSRAVAAGVATAVNRAVLGDDSLEDSRIIFTSNTAKQGGRHFGCRMVISENHLYLSIGDRGDRDTAQDGALHGGSVVRLGLDGSVPDDNPSANSPSTSNSSASSSNADNPDAKDWPDVQDWIAENYTIGHRNPQGMAIHPETGALWVHEHGPRGGDEINILKAGANYGWPITSHGREYSGGAINNGLRSAPGVTDPVWVWVPSIAPSGMAFYQGDRFPELKDTLLVGSLVFRSLYVVVLEGGVPKREEAILKRRIGRVRDVAVGVDGSVLLLSDEHGGGLYRLR